MSAVLPFFIIPKGATMSPILKLLTKQHCYVVMVTNGESIFCMYLKIFLFMFTNYLVMFFQLFQAVICDHLTFTGEGGDTYATSS